jgi:hypothetical protein
MISKLVSRHSVPFRAAQAPTVVRLAQAIKPLALNRT